MTKPDTTREELLAFPIGIWIEIYVKGFRYENIRGKNCMISLAPTLATNRGNWIAAVESFNQIEFTVDWADGFPRYYFDYDRAKAELEAWLVRRNQIEEEARS